MIYSRLPHQPKKNFLDSIETSGIILTPDNPHLKNWHLNYLKGQKKRLAIDLELITTRVPKNQKILEAGSAPFILTHALQNEKYSIIGMDIAPERYEQTLEKLALDIRACNIETDRLPFSDNSFDLVLFNELFEHLRIDLIFTLNEVLRVLKPEGKLMLSTPNLRSVVGIQNFLLKNKSYSCSAKIYNEYKKLHTLGHMGHVREYTTQEVITFLKKIGFELEEIAFRGRYFGWKKGVNKIFPKLSPFVSYVARKPSRLNDLY